MSVLENVKAFASIGARALLRGIAIAVTGFLLSLIGFLLIFYHHAEGKSVSGGHFGGIGIFWDIPVESKAGALVFFGAPLFLMAYIFLAYKMVIQTVLYSVWESKLVGFIQPRIKSLVAGLAGRQPGWLKGITSWATLKLQLIAANNTAPESSFVKKRLVNYGLKKIKLDGIDFRRDDLDLPEVISSKIITVISETAKPSPVLFLLLFGIHLALLLWDLLTPNAPPI